MPDFSKAKIYKIYSYENDNVYYGSTVETLSCRMSHHRAHFKRYKNGKNAYITSFKILELTSAKIELVENFPCNSKEELLQREGFYIRNNNCVNKNIMGRTKKEYGYDTKENKKEYDIMYRESNKEKLNKQNTCECGGEYLTKHKSTHIKTLKHINYKQQLNTEDTNINQI